MKVLHLTTVATSHQLLLLPQLVALADAGYEVVAVSANGPETEVLRQHGIRHRALAGSTRGFDLRSDLRAAWSFAAIVRDERPDVVHTHNPKPGVYGRIIARLLGVERVVNTVHGLYATPTDGWRRRAAVYGAEALAARFSHLELVQNAEDFDLMTRTPLAPMGRVRFLGNGIDLERFAIDAAASRADIRRELGIDEHEVVVGSVGRLVSEKGFPELLRASSEIAAPHRLVVVGPDDPEKPDALPAEAIREATASGVRFLGRRDDIERILPALDVFVLASHREGVPRSAMEAAAVGLPVVATDIRGCRQVVDDGETGFLVPKGDAGSLAATIAKLVEDPELRRSMGAAGRRKAVAEFDEQLVLDRLWLAYGELGVPHGQGASTATMRQLERL